LPAFQSGLSRLGWLVSNTDKHCANFSKRKWTNRQTARVSRRFWSAGVPMLILSTTSE